MSVTKEELIEAVLSPSQKTLEGAGWSGSATWESWAEASDKLLYRMRRVKKIKDLVLLTKGLEKYLEVMLKVHKVWPADKVELDLSGGVTILQPDPITKRDK